MQQGKHKGEETWQIVHRPDYSAATPTARRETRQSNSSPKYSPRRELHGEHLRAAMAMCNPQEGAKEFTQNGLHFVHMEDGQKLIFHQQDAKAQTQSSSSSRQSHP